MTFHHHVYNVVKVDKVKKGGLTYTKKPNFDFLNNKVYRINNSYKRQKKKYNKSKLSSLLYTKPNIKGKVSEHSKKPFKYVSPKDLEASETLLNLKTQLPITELKPNIKGNILDLSKKPFKYVSPKDLEASKTLLNLKTQLPITELKPNIQNITTNIIKPKLKPLDIKIDTSTLMYQLFPNNNNNVVPSIKKESDKENGLIRFINNHSIRNKIKERYPNYCIFEIDDYLRTEWANMDKQVQSTWNTNLDKYLESLTQKFKRLDEISKPDEIPKPNEIPRPDEIPKQEVDFLKKEDTSKLKIINNDLVGKHLYNDELHEDGSILGIYKRKGRKTRFRVEWKNRQGDVRKELLYRHNILQYLMNE
jgi:hypothetical protein